ncbi:MAG: hypothetical protein ACR2H9_02410 [Longimicrobiaceae bacterium]
MVKELPRILWVAARPPLPPPPRVHSDREEREGRDDPFLFSGGAIKSQSAIAALSSVTEIELLTFAPTDSAALEERFRRFWSGSPVSLHLLEPGRQVGALEALRRGRFQTSISIEASGLGDRLQELDWEARENLVVLDDIVFAPLLPRYGRNALFSPHDCVSEMFRSHSRIAVSLRSALRYRVLQRIAQHYETEFYHHALLTHLVTERDRILLQGVNPGARYHVAPYVDEGLRASSPPVLSYTWDVVIWANLAIPSSVRGTQAFLAAVATDPKWRHIRLALIGRVPAANAEQALGRSSLSRLEYSPYLEDERGQIRHAKITVVPDIGGSGIKSRCLGLLASRKCVACLYSQMEGIQSICDSGAVNASSPEALAARVKAVLRAGLYEGIAAEGHEIYAREFDKAVLHRKWIDMVRRALVIRDDLQGTRPLGSRAAETRNPRRNGQQSSLPAVPERVQPVRAQGET